MMRFLIEESMISLVIVMLKLKSPQILTRERYIMSGVSMENCKISLVIVMLTTKDSSIEET